MIDETKYSGRHNQTPTGEAHEIQHLNLEALWSPVYLIEDEDAADGGEYGLANLQAQELGNRTELLLEKIRALERIVYARTEDGAKRVLVQQSKTKPSESNRAWLISASNEVVLNPEARLTLEGGEVVSLYDTGARATVENVVYEFASAEAMGLVEVTIGGGRETIEVTVAAEESGYVTDDMFDDLINGDDDG